MQIMRKDAPSGTKVKFTGFGGFQTELDTARKYLSEKKTYTVKSMQEEGSRVVVFLKEVPGQKFNSVMFAETY